MNVGDGDTTYWFVWCPDSGPPTRRHFSLETAEEEAKRLAAGNPGKQFLVLELVGVAQKVDVSYRRCKQIEIPF